MNKRKRVGVTQIRIAIIKAVIYIAFISFSTSVLANAESKPQVKNDKNKLQKVDSDDERVNDPKTKIKIKIFEADESTRSEKTKSSSFPTGIPLPKNWKSSLETNIPVWI